MKMIYLFPYIILLFIIACKIRPDLQHEEQAIRQLLQQERKAHFDRNVNAFMSEFADSMMMINRGKVETPSREMNKKRIGDYFGSVRFLKWDDVAEPVIRFSADASLAYAIVQKEVILTYNDTLEKPLYDTAHYAWVSVYRRQKGEWKVECNISTNK
jgi:hypothetical protein